jgi:hypothetical protein
MSLYNDHYQNVEFLAKSMDGITCTLHSTVHSTQHHPLLQILLHFHTPSFTRNTIHHTWAGGARPGRRTKNKPPPPPPPPPPRPSSICPPSFGGAERAEWGGVVVRAGVGGGVCKGRGRQHSVSPLLATCSLLHNIYAHLFNSTLQCNSPSPPPHPPIPL